MWVGPLPSPFNPSQDEGLSSASLHSWLSTLCKGAEGGRECEESKHMVSSWSLHQQGTIVRKTWTARKGSDSSPRPVTSQLCDLRYGPLHFIIKQAEWSIIFEFHLALNILILSMLIPNSSCSLLTQLYRGIKNFTKRGRRKGRVSPVFFIMKHLLAISGLKLVNNC